MIALYKTVPEKTIRKEVKESIPKIEEWFKLNPKRKVCRTSLWYGKIISIRRKTIAQQLNAAADEAINHKKP